METIGAYEAKTHLPRMLDEVDRGEKTFVITKHGRPVAQLGPADGPKKHPADVITGLRAARKGVRLDGLTLSELINEGRL